MLGCDVVWPKNINLVIWKENANSESNCPLFICKMILKKWDTMKNCKRYKIPYVLLEKR